MPYDLLIKGGHVLDPGQNLDGVMDIAINGSKIAAVAPNIDAAEASRVIEVKGVILDSKSLLKNLKD